VTRPQSHIHDVRAMSALPPKADTSSCDVDVRFGPMADIRRPIVKLVTDPRVVGQFQSFGDNFKGLIE
jgi:hypothetical protein